MLFWFLFKQEIAFLKNEISGNQISGFCKFVRFVVLVQMSSAVRFQLGFFDFELQFLYQFQLGHATFALADWN